MKRLIAALTLLAAFPSIALGWSRQLVHPSQTDMALRLIEFEDTAGRYRRLYARNWWPGATSGDHFNPQVIADTIVPGDLDHPAVIGAFSEELWGRHAFGVHRWDADAVLNWAFSRVAFGDLPISREANHYGFGLEGMQWTWREEVATSLIDPDDWFASSPDCARGADRYAAADVWGAGNGACGNVMGFFGGVHVYRYGTAQAMREGVRRAGHALHVLQDMGQPDHGRGIINFHCSDVDDGDFRNELRTIGSTALGVLEASLYVFTGIAGTPPDPVPSDLPDDDDWVYPAARTVAAKVTELAERRSEGEFRDGYVGFDGFTFMRWFEVLLALGETPPVSLHAPSYAAFMRDANANAQAIAAGISEDTPLGCTVHGDRGIHTVDANEGWLVLATDLNRAVIGRSAGMLMHFFDVVNPPPVAVEITVAQPNAAGGAYAAEWRDVLEARPELEWHERSVSSSGPPGWYLSHSYVEHVPNVLVRRELVEAPSKPLLAGVDATVRVRFGPNDITPKAMANARVRLLGEEVPLGLASTDADGQWWEGTLPVACDASAGTRALEVLGADAEAHLAARADAGLPMGDQLDGNPATVAFADDADPNLALAGYETAAPRFFVDVDYLAYHGLRAVGRVFGATGWVRGAERATVYRDVSAHTSGLLDQAHRLDAVIDTDHGAFAAAMLRRCVGVTWTLGTVKHLGTGAALSPADGMVVELDDRGDHAVVYATPSPHTPTGVYAAVIEVEGDAFGIAPYSVVVEFEVADLPDGFGRIAGRFFEAMGFDPKELAAATSGLDVFLALRDLLGAPTARLDGCLSTPNILCWGEYPAAAKHFDKWIEDWNVAKAVGAWLDYGKQPDEYDEFGIGVAMLDMLEVIDAAAKPGPGLDVEGLPVDFGSSNPEAKIEPPPGWDD